ncbi:MAG: PH domain-containing protein [Bacteroidia bacterium]
MKTIYKSKVGLSFIIPVAVILVIILIAALYDHDWMMAAILGVTLGYAGFISACTLYTINDGELTVQAGSLYKRHIDIASIRRVNEVFNIINAPATSFRRLEIWYNNHSYILISPKDKELFVAQLKALNPSIEFHLKK